MRVEYSQSNVSEFLNLITVVGALFLTEAATGAGRKGKEVASEIAQ